MVSLPLSLVAGVLAWRSAHSMHTLGSGLESITTGLLSST
jgi:hypothetical protein